MNARKGRSERRAWLSALAITLVCLVFTSCSPNTEQQNLDQFRKGLDSIRQAFGVDDYESVVRQFEKLHAIPLTTIPLSDEVRYWKYLYIAGFETEDYDVAIQAGVASLGLDWDDQDIRSTLPYIPMGHAIKKAGDTAKAIEWYKLALNNVAEVVRADVMSNLATLYVATGDYRRALIYTDLSSRLIQFGGVTDEVAVAWTHVIKARSYGGLRMYKQAEAQLDSALEIFEQQKRDGEPFSQKDVRMSLYRGVWKDSLNLRHIGSQWRRIDERLQKLYQRDSIELESIGVPKVRKHKHKGLHTVVPHYLAASYQKVPASLHPAMVTSSIVDVRGWKWVGTLRGLYIDIGDAILPVETLPFCDSRRPVRALSGDERHLRILRYDGSTDTIAWLNLIGKGRLPSPVYLPLVTFSSIPWIGKPPTGMVSMLDTSQVMYFYGNRYGVGSLHRVPSQLFTAQTDHSDNWQGSVNCGISLHSDTLILGTDRGLWYFTPSSNQMFRVRLSPDYLNEADIKSMGQLIDGSLRATIPFFHPVVFDTIRIGKKSPMIARQEMKPYHYERTLATANPIVTYLSGINSPHTGDVKNRPAPIYSVPTPGLRVWMWDRTLYLHDAIESTFTLHSIPDSLPIDSTFSVASFGAKNNVIGFLSDRSLLVASVTHTNQGPSQRLVAYRTPKMTHFKIAAESAVIELSGNDRDLEFGCGRPMSWGATSIRQTMLLPWSGQIITSRTNRVEYIRSVPVGEHDLFIRSDDRYDALHIHIAAVPTLVETAWFRVSLIIVFLGLLTGSVRYVALARRSRRDAEERILNSERLQIGQDVHDAIGADLVRISMVARAEPSRENNFEIARLTREASRTLRDIIWSVSEAHTVDAVIAITVERIRAMCDESGVSLTVQLPTEFSRFTLSPQSSRDIVLIITEAMTNIIKHAHAQTVSYDVCDDAQGLTLALSDDGRGFVVDATSEGVGIKSIRSRAQRSGFGILITSTRNAGTRVSITIPFDAA